MKIAEIPLLVLLLLMVFPYCADAATIKSISAGGGSMVLMDDGTVYAWGNNASHYLPKKVQGLSNIVAISSYGANYMALTRVGDVWMWTWLDNQDSPPDLVKIPTSNVTAISVPTMLKNDGTVWEITPQNSHSLFIEDVKNAGVRQVPGLDNVTAIGRDVAIRDDGTIWTWLNISQGSPLVGQYDPVVPVKVDISNVKEVVTSDSATLALKNDGTVWVWGNNGFNLFGDGKESSSYDPSTGRVSWDSSATLAPVQIKDLINITSVSVSTDLAWALKDDGTVWMWGADQYGSEGGLTPKKFSGLNGIVAISMGDRHAFALKNDGTLWAWGGNWQGQSGDGTVTNPLDNSGGRDYPVKVHIDTSGPYSISVTPSASPSLSSSVNPSPSGNASVVVPSAGGSAVPVGGGLPLGDGGVSVFLCFLGLLAGGVFVSLRGR